MRCKYLHFPFVRVIPPGRLPRTSNKINFKGRNTLLHLSGLRHLGPRSLLVTDTVPIPRPVPLLPNNAISPDKIAQQPEPLRSEMMEDASSENASANTAQQQPLQQQQQAAWTVYRPAATTTMGHMGNGVKILPKHYTACEFADLVELIGTSVTSRDLRTWVFVYDVLMDRV